MPAKHIRSFGPARLIFCFTAAILVLLVMWVAVRAVGPAEASRQPTVVLPSMPRVTVAPPSASPRVSLSPSPSPSPSRSRSASPKPSLTSARPSPSTAPPRVTPATTKPVVVVPRDLTAAVGVTASWNAGYVAIVRVQNTGSAAHTWSVTVTHQGQNGLRLGPVWGAAGSQRGTSLVFSGGPLAAGASATFGYQTSTTGPDKARPAGCTVVGGTCAVR